MAIFGTYEDLISLRASRGIVADYYNNYDKRQGIDPPYEYKILRDMVESDAVLGAAIDLTIDLVTVNGFDFYGKNKRLIEEARKLFNDKLDFDQVIDNILYQMIIYGDAFLELGRTNSGKVTALYPLETTEMVIDYDEHGEIKGYIQKPQHYSRNRYIYFSPDEVIHFKLKSIGSAVYSATPFKPIFKDSASSIYANDYLKQIFRNLPPKMVYFLRGASDKQRKQFITNVRKAKTNPMLDIVATSTDAGAMESKILQYDFDNGLLKVLEYLQKRVLAITRVPPHWIGMLEGANRGIGENVTIPFETRIRKIRQKIESQINRELLPRLGLGTLEFKFNPSSFMDEKAIVEIMQRLKAINMDSDTILNYAKQRGFPLLPGSKIVEEIKEPANSVEKDAYLSRNRENLKTDKMKVNLNKKGVSDEGKEKLEMAQMQTRSIEILEKYGKYW